MSLSVILLSTTSSSKKKEPKIVMRINGENREVSRMVWDELNPGVEPIELFSDDNDSSVYSANITHNLNTMASAAEIYQALWRPEEINITTANQLIQPLTEGLSKLEADPDRFKRLNPSNGWGSYDVLVRFVKNYLQACKDNPNATVGVSR